MTCSLQILCQVTLEPLSVHRMYNYSTLQYSCRLLAILISSPRSQTETILGMARFLKKVLLLAMAVVLCLIQVYDMYNMYDMYPDTDVISQVLRLQFVKSVEDWPHGIKFAKWTNGDALPIDWNWVKILDKVLIPG